MHLSSLSCSHVNVSSGDFDSCLTRAVKSLPGNERVVFKLEVYGNPQAFPDGMTIDTEGKLWIACFHAGRVIHVDPETGARIWALLHFGSQ